MKAEQCERLADDLPDSAGRRTLREAAEHWRPLAVAAEAPRRAVVPPVAPQVTQSPPAKPTKAEALEAWLREVERTRKIP